MSSKCEASTDPIVMNQVQNMQAEAALAEKASKEKGALRASDPKTQTNTKGVRLSKEEELKRGQEVEREKRAAAAEKRIAALNAQRTSTTETTSSSEPQRGVASDINCSCCNVSLAGKVPFHRYHYKYCSTSCMHVHREILED